MSLVDLPDPSRHRRALQAADDQIFARRSDQQDDSRPEIHFAAPTGWINDPNGLLFFEGRYHLFYQYNPFGNRWGPMHWGHATSTDLVTWEHLPVALAPSEEYDLDPEGGCFSGSVVEDHGVMSILYTGSVIRDGQLVQVQCLATSADGRRFDKYEHNPVIAAPPAGHSSSSFRDPKVFRHGGRWYMVVGSSIDGRGCALLYSAEELTHWTYLGVVASGTDDMGSMWECPDLFPVDDTWVLMFSPMGTGSVKTIYLVGEIDFAECRFTWHSRGQVDHGIDFYAPQTYLAADGRRLLIGWMNSWHWMPGFKDFGPPWITTWCGSLSLPREVRLRDGERLTFAPVHETHRLRTAEEEPIHAVLDEGTHELPLQPDAGPIELAVELEIPHALTRVELSLLADDGRHAVSLTYRPNDEVLSLDRNGADGWSEGVATARVELQPGGLLDLRVVLDSTSIELFAGAYDTAMSATVYMPRLPTRLALTAVGGGVVVRRLQAWPLAGTEGSDADGVDVAP